MQINLEQRGLKALELGSRQTILLKELLSNEAMTTTEAATRVDYDRNNTEKMLNEWARMGLLDSWEIPSMGRYPCIRYQLDTDYAGFWRRLRKYVDSWFIAQIEMIENEKK